MAYGLQIFDAAGNIRLDTGDKYIRCHSTLSGTITQATSPVSIAVTGIADDGTWGFSSDIPLDGDYSSTDDVAVDFGAVGFLELTIQHTDSGDFAYRIQIFRI